MHRDWYHGQTYSIFSKHVTFSETVIFKLEKNIPNGKVNEVNMPLTPGREGIGVTVGTNVARCRPTRDRNV